MEDPNKHSVSKANMILPPNTARLVLLFRGVHQKNLDQAEAHLKNCNNDDDKEDCKCDSV